MIVQSAISVVPEQILDVFSSPYVLVLAAVFGLLVALDTGWPSVDSRAAGSVTAAAGLVTVGLWGTIVAACPALIAAGLLRVPLRLSAWTLAARLSSLGVGYTVLELLQGRTIWAGVVTVVMVIVLEQAILWMSTSGGLSGTSSRGVERTDLGDVNLLLAGLSTAALTVLIFPSTGSWAFALMALLLLLIRQSFYLLANIQDTYVQTVQVLAEAAECEGPKCGHAQRTAVIARRIGVECGIRRDRVAQIEYAALLHDFEVGGVRADLVRPAEVVKDLPYFEPATRILDESRWRDAGSGRDLMALSAYIVALADAIDCAENPGVAAAHTEPKLESLYRRVSDKSRRRALNAAVRLGYLGGDPA